MISYSTRRRELALRVRDRLAKCGGPRIDCLDIAYGERFKEQLALWLSYCHAAVVLLSEEAALSPWVRYELSVLVNRERLGELTLVVLLVDGMTASRLAELPDLGPHALGDLQGATIASDATDAEIDAAIERVAKATGCEIAIAGLVRGVNHWLSPVGTVPLAEARARLRTALASDVDLAAELDAWFDDPALADVRDGGTRLRWALAGELCAMPVELVYHPLEQIAQKADVAGLRLDRIVDLNAMTAFDSASTATLHSEMCEPRRGVVLGCTQQPLAELAPAAALQLHLGPEHRCYWLEIKLTGAGIDDYVGQVERQLELAIEDQGGNVDRLVARRRRLGHPLVVLLSGCDGLTKEILAEIRKRLPAFTFVVLATAASGPEAWSARLGGLPVVGPRPAADGWPAMMGDEAQLVGAWVQAREDVRELGEPASGP